MDKAINSLTFVLCPYHVSSSFVIFFVRRLLEGWKVIIVVTKGNSRRHTSYTRWPQKTVIYGVK